MILLRIKREVLVLKNSSQFRIHQDVPWDICKSFLKIPKVETPSSQKIFCSKANLSVRLPICLSVCLLCAFLKFEEYLIKTFFTLQKDN
jgi:hypothetical protein